MACPLSPKFYFLGFLAEKMNCALECPRAIVTGEKTGFAPFSNIRAYIFKVTWRLSSFCPLANSILRFLCVRDIVSSISSAVPLWERDRATAGDLGWLFIRLIESHNPWPWLEHQRSLPTKNLSLSSLFSLSLSLSLSSIATSLGWEIEGVVKASSIRSVASGRFMIDARLDITLPTIRCKFSVLL